MNNNTSCSYRYSVSDSFGHRISPLKNRKDGTWMHFEASEKLYGYWGDERYKNKFKKRKRR